MTASILDGKAVAELRLKTLKKRVQTYIEKHNQPPSLAVILIGDDPASAIYVKNKCKACAEIGIKSYTHNLSTVISEQELLKLIDELNNAPQVNGILIQLPLPIHINETVILEHISTEKDVDGFHPYNLGRLAQKNPLLRPCTPLGIINLIKHYELEIKGSHAVVVGASNIVGRPMSLEFLLAGATVTTCHRLTKNIQHFIESADIVVIAAGVTDIIDVEWLKKHQIIIDVGIHRLSSGALRGDIDYEKALSKVRWITPVPGGVGPMTIVTLLENTMSCAEQSST